MALPLGGDIPPNPTIYVNNLYEKLRKEGETPTHPPTHPPIHPTPTQGARGLLDRTFACVPSRLSCCSSTL